MMMKKHIIQMMARNVVVRKLMLKRINGKGKGFHPLGTPNKDAV
jgi:hypothetical protein